MLASGLQGLIRRLNSTAHKIPHFFPITCGIWKPFTFIWNLAWWMLQSHQCNASGRWMFFFLHLVTAGSPSGLPSAFKRAANASEEILLMSGISPNHQPMSVCCVPTQQMIHTCFPLLSALSSKSGYHHQFSLPFLSPQIQCLLVALALFIFPAHLPCLSKGWCLQRTHGPFFMTVLSQNLNDHLYADRP